MKKTLITIISLVTALLASLHAAHAASASHTGVVKESHDAGIYTYFLVEEADRQYWIAGPKTRANAGERISFDEQLTMENFHSKSLNRDFETVMFVSNVQTPDTQHAGASAHASRATLTQSTARGDAGKVTVADIFKRKQELDGQLLTVHGEVVKVSPNIMGKTWVHIKDGTGQGEESKVIFLSGTESANVGETVTAKGVLAIDQDFGYGYFYSAIVEDASFTR